MKKGQIPFPVETTTYDTYEYKDERIDEEGKVLS